jgi:Domain of unknown function (DUF3517)
VVTHTLRICIGYFGLDLLAADEKEEYAPGSREELALNVRRFVDGLVALLYTEVARNWMKFQQFFELFRELAASSEAFLQYVVQKEVTSMFLDIYLERKSPLTGFPEKKHALGNRYYPAQTESLVAFVSVVVKRACLPSFDVARGRFPRTFEQSRPPVELSAATLACLQVPELYEKVTKEKAEGAVGQLISELVEHVCYENSSLSNAIIEFLLKSISRASFDDVAPFLETLKALLTIKDGDEHVRIEAAFGYPVLFSTPSYQGGETRLFFGLPTSNALDTTVICYENLRAVGETQTLLNFLVTNKSRWEMLTAVCLRYLLSIALESEDAFLFLMRAPGVSYLHANFCDWVEGFIETYMAETSKYYYSPMTREELGKKAKDVFLQFKTKALAFQKAHALEAPESVLPSSLPRFIVGNIVAETEYASFTIADPDDKYALAIQVSEFAVHLVRSQPTLYTNLALPQKYVRGAQVQAADVPLHSNLSDFLDLRLYRRPPLITSQDRRPAAAGRDEKPETTDLRPIILDIPAYNSEDGHQAAAAGEGPSRLQAAGEPPAAAADPEGYPSQKHQHAEAAAFSLEPAAEPEGFRAVANPLQPVAGILSQEANPPAAAAMGQEESPEEEDMVQDAFVAPYILRFVATNNESCSLGFECRIIYDDPAKINFAPICGGIQGIVRPKGQVPYLTLTKLDPLKGWGDFEIEVFITQVETGTMAYPVTKKVGFKFRKEAECESP